MGGIYLSCPRSPPFQSFCLHLSQHDMVWKLPVCLLMMINVHSHVSNLGSREESWIPLPRATCRGSWWCGALCFCPSEIPPRFLHLPPAPGGSFSGLWHQELSWSRWAGPHMASLPCPLGHFWLEPPCGVSARVTPSCPSLPAPKSGQRGAKFPPQQVPVIYLKIVANIWYNCLRKHSNKAACSSIAERASPL